MSESKGDPGVMTKIDELAAEYAAAANQLSEKILATERAFQALKGKLECTVPVGSSLSIRFARVGGDWQLLLGEQGVPQLVRLADAKLEVKIRAGAFLPKLALELLSKQEARVKQIRAATDGAEEALRMLGGEKREGE